MTAVTLSRPPTTQQPLQRTSLISRLNTNIVRRVLIQFLSLEDLFSLRESHRSGIRLSDCAYALQCQMDTRGKAYEREIWQFRKITGGPFYSRQITHLDVSRSDKGDEQLYEFLPLMPNLCSIDAEGCRNITDKGLECIGLVCSKLTHINVASCFDISDAGVQLIAKGCPELESLEIANTPVGEEGLQPLVKHCTKLTNLDIVGCDVSNVSAVFPFSESCLKLRRLNILNLLFNDSFQRVVDSCPELESLSFGSQHHTHLQDEHLQLVGKRLKKLHTLELIGCQDITDAGLQHLGNGLRVLSVVQCYEAFPIIALQRLVGRCDKLERLSIGDSLTITDKILQFIVEVRPELLSLSLGRCPQITCKGLQHVVDTCKKLAELDVKFCAKVMNSDIQLLKSNYPKIQITGWGSTPNAFRKFLNRFSS